MRVRQAHTGGFGGLCACVAVRESENESESRSEMVCVCVKTFSMVGGVGKRESPRWTGILFLLGSLCSASDLID